MSDMATPHALLEPGSALRPLPAHPETPRDVLSFRPIGFDLSAFGTCHGLGHWNQSHMAAIHYSSICQEVLNASVVAKSAKTCSVELLPLWLPLKLRAYVPNACIAHHNFFSLGQLHFRPNKEVATTGSWYPRMLSISQIQLGLRSHDSTRLHQ
jgi:hypothetical protein